MHSVLFTGMLFHNYDLLSKARISAYNLTLAGEEVQQEIEERKWAEAMLQESRVFAESIVETIREPLLVLDSELRIIKVNRSFHQAFRIKPQQVINKLFYQISNGLWNIPELLEKLKSVLPEDAQFERYEVTRDFGKLGERTMLLNARPIYRKEVDTNLILLAMDDITDRVKAQEAARRLVRGIESAAEAVIMTNVQGDITYVNPAFTALTGYEAREVLGRKTSILRSPQHSEDFYAKMWQCILSGNVWSGEITNAKKDGSLHTVILTIAPVLDDNQKIEGFVASQNDITELKSAKEELLRRADELSRSNAELEQFAYIASHDLQEPLRMISSYCQLLQRRYDKQLDNDGIEFIRFAVDGAKRMQNLINDLLAYSRVGTRGQPFKTTDCNQIMRQVTDNLKLAIEESGVKIDYADLPTILGDETQLVQLFQNLVGNAIKFRRKDQPEIGIDTVRENGRWVFSISDNGIGIDENFAERIFVIFQRLHNNSEYAGTGIGLAICKKIVERHGGQIWVQSRQGEGSTFSFTLLGKR
jgi:PAS domain S-box-containing protein